MWYYPGFCGHRNNFLKLDVYYGELKYESVQRQKGYNFLDYLGKVNILQSFSLYILIKSQVYIPNF